MVKCIVVHRLSRQNELVFINSELAEHYGYLIRDVVKVEVLFIGFLPHDVVRVDRLEVSLDLAFEAHTSLRSRCKCPLFFAQLSPDLS